MRWQNRKLKELFRIGSSKRVLKSQWQKSGVPFYRGREITLLAKSGSVENELFITQELYEEYSQKYGVPIAGDIMVTAIGTIGNTYIVRNGEKFYFKDASVLWLKKISQVDSEFVNYWFKSSLMREQLDEGNGATVDTLTIKKLQSLNIYFPQLTEQKQIVAILDDAFANIDRARKLAERNLNNARELFDSTLNQVFFQRGLEWGEKTLGEVVKVERGSSPRPIKSYITNKPNGVNWIKIGDVKEGEKYITKTKEKITPAGALKSRYVKEGDFLLTNSMSYGRPFILKTEGYIHDGWFVLRLPLYIDTDYFYFLLVSPYIKEQFGSLAAGAIVQNISSDLVKKAKLPIPPIDEQKSIAQKLDLISDDVKLLEKTYQQKIMTLDELKQSLLQKAFRGELTQKDVAA